MESIKDEEGMREMLETVQAIVGATSEGDLIVVSEAATAAGL